MTPYLLVLIGLVGFSAGVLVGIVLDDLIELPIGKEGRTMKDRLSNARDRFSVKSRTIGAWLLIVALLFNGANAFLLLSARADTDALAKCVAAYNQQFSEAYQARFDSSSKATKALDRVILAVAQKDKVEFKASIDAYVKARMTAVADQKANPYPDLPASFCGEELDK